jgi:hypothetical protein
MMGAYIEPSLCTGHFSISIVLSLYQRLTTGAKVSQANHDGAASILILIIYGGMSIDYESAGRVFESPRAPFPFSPGHAEKSLLGQFSIRFVILTHF